MVILERMSFTPLWISVIYQYISTMTYKVFFNGVPSTLINLAKGPRYGDPLSPYFFILRANVLSIMLSKVEDDHLIQGMRLGKNALLINHPLYADNLMVIFKATFESYNYLQASYLILESYLDYG